MTANKKPIHSEDIAIDDIFSATLKPYRSLSQNGFIILMILFGGTCFLMGVFYIVVGAWPIFIFLGIDVLLIYFAFKINYRSGRAFEEVILRRDALIIRRISATGTCKELYLNPFWTKLHLEHDDENNVTKITLRNKDEETLLGHFLNPDDKTSFAIAFSAALSRAKTV